MDFMSRSEVGHAVVSEKLDKVIEHTSKTNGRVHKLEIEDRRIEEQTKELFGSLKVDMEQRHGEVMQELGKKADRSWVWKTVVVVIFASSFIFIKESRDAIISLLNLFL